MRLHRRVATTVAAVALLLSACSDSDGASSQNDSDPIRLYGSDGVMQDGLAAGLADPAVLAGMKGTAPSTPLPTDFTNRLLEIDSSLASFPYAGETYDAVIISALAAELAGTPDPAVVRTYVNSVTTGGQRCVSPAACLDLARAGEQLEYRGVSMRGGFTDLGEPATATYATLHFGADGAIDPNKTEYVGAGDLTAVTEAEPPEPGPRPDRPGVETEPLRFGGLLPETGALSETYHAPMAAAAQLAIEEINSAGGVLGVDVQWRDGDDGSLDADVARRTLSDHVDDDVHVMIGPAASDTTEAVLPEAVAARRLLFSPASTRADLGETGDEGYFFRTAPPDDLQGAALADMVLRDGAGEIAIVARDGVYGQGLQADVNTSLQRFGVPESDLTLITYPALDGASALPADQARSLAEQIRAATPDVVVLIGFGEAGGIVQAMIDADLPLAA